jgi:hypothetical protein
VGFAQVKDSHVGNVVEDVLLSVVCVCQQRRAAVDEAFLWCLFIG